MNSFSADVGSRKIPCIQQTSCKNISLHQKVKVTKEINETSIDIDPYCHKIKIKRVDRIREIHPLNYQDSSFISYMKEGLFLEMLLESLQDDHLFRMEGRKFLL